MNASLLLAIATLALVVGPLLERAARRQPRLAGIVDGLTVGGIVVVALLHLMPESTAHLGLWAPLLMIVGIFVPQLAERSLAHRWHGWRISVGALILVVFVGHLLVEGAALASTATDERLALATVLVVAGHNLPLGVLLWGHTRKRFGSAWSVAVIGAVAAITWFGPLLPISSGNFSALCSALLAGGLLHLVLEHESTTGEPGTRAVRNPWAAVGALGAAWVLIRYLDTSERGEAGVAHAHGGPHLPAEFGELFLETAPPLLFGVLAAGLIEAFLPDVATRWLGRGSSFGQALRGVAIGTPMPVCSCGVLPVYRALIRKGVPATAGMALLVSAPEIDIATLLLSVPMLGWKTTIARLVAALALALAIGWIVGRMVRTTPAAQAGGGGAVDGGAACVEPVVAGRPGGARLVRGVYETWAHLGPWILLGLFATVFIEHFFLDQATDWARSIPPWQQVIALSLIGLPSYICATAATPLAALLLASGFSPGAVLAFLLTGPATNWTTLAVLDRIHSRRVAVAFTAVALGTTFLLGLLVNVVLPPGSFTPPEVGDHAHGALHVACAAVLCGLTLWVALREGPRGFLSQLSPSAAHAHEAREGASGHAAHAGHAH